MRPFCCGGHRGSAYGCRDPCAPPLAGYTLFNPFSHLRNESFWSFYSIGREMEAQMSERHIFYLVKDQGQGQEL